MCCWDCGSNVGFLQRAYVWAAAPRVVYSEILLRSLRRRFSVACWKPNLEASKNHSVTVLVKCESASVKSFRPAECRLAFMLDLRLPYNFC